MSAAALVSIVLCTYQQGEYLTEAIDSVFAQTYPNIELVAVDNGSRDGSREILERYTDRPNVRLLLHERNGPVTIRLNEAIQASHGEFVSLLYGDDLYLPEKTARQVAAFATLDASYGVVYAPGWRLDQRTGARRLQQGLVAEGQILREMLLRYHTADIVPISPLFRRACFERYPFREDLFVEAEGQLFRVALTFAFHRVTEPLVVMRDHDHNIGKAYERNNEVTMAVLERLEHEASFPSDLRPILTDIRARAMRNLGWQLVRLAADGPAARRAFASAVRWRRHQLLHPRTLIGLVLSLLPVPVLRAANRAGHRLRGHDAPVAYRSDYF